MISQLPEAKGLVQASRHLVLGVSSAGGLYEMG